MFSQFTGFLVFLRERLDATNPRYQYFDDSILTGKRIAAFQSGEGDFFLIGLKADVLASIHRRRLLMETRRQRPGPRPHPPYCLVTHESIEARIVQLYLSKRELTEEILGSQ